MARPGISEILEPQKIPPKYRKNTKNAHLGYFQGIFSVFWGYFGGKIWESRTSGQGVFFRYFSWKFRVGPFRGSVAGRGVLNIRWPRAVAYFTAYFLRESVFYAFWAWQVFVSKVWTQPLPPFLCFSSRMNVSISRHYPEGPARQIDVSRQKLSPHCLEAIFDSQLPLPKLSSKMPPKLSLPTKEGFLSSFKINPAVRVIARQVRDKNCLAAIFAPRHQSVSSGPLGTRHYFALFCLKICYCSWPPNLQGHWSGVAPVVPGIPWPALRGPLRNFWKRRHPQPYWGGENSVERG